MKKYRIIKEVDGLGNSFFYPQYRDFIFWNYFIDCNGYYRYKVYFTSEQDAIDYIKNHIKELEEKTLKNKIVSKTIIKYP